VKVSDEDLRWLHPNADPLEVALRWHRSGPAVVVVTFGAGGASAVTAATTVTVAAIPTRVVDTVGAGDTFMGALIDGLIDGGYAGADRREALRRIPRPEMEAILGRAAAAAAITVSRPGADPPFRTELSSHFPRLSARPFSAAALKG
jgi:fructokinase